MLDLQKIPINSFHISHHSVSPIVNILQTVNILHNQHTFVRTKKLMLLHYYWLKSRLRLDFTMTFCINVLFLFQI